jgi:hypothetical protein
MKKIPFLLNCILCGVTAVAATLSACAPPLISQPANGGSAAQVPPTYTPLPTYTPNPTPTGECASCTACPPTPTAGPTFTPQPPCPTCEPLATASPFTSPLPPPKPAAPEGAQPAPAPTSTLEATATVTETSSVPEGAIALKMIMHNRYLDPWAAVELAPGGTAELFWQESNDTWGEAVTTIGDKTYQINRDAPNPDAPEQHLPEPYSYQFSFSQNLIDRTRNNLGGNSSTGEWWAGPLGCSASTDPPVPFDINVELKKGDEVVAQATFSFTVADKPDCNPGQYGD